VAVRLLRDALVVAQPFYVEREDARIEHRAEPVMLVLALLVIPAIVVEEASADWLRAMATALNVVIWVGFAVEFLFVLAVSSHRMRTLRTHWLDAVIVVVSVPVWPAVLQGARVLRLLRLVRLLAFGARAVTAARRLFSPAGLRYVAPLVAFLVVIAGAAISSVDPDDVHDIEDGIWWALATVTTVGYGDVVPHSTAGRAVAVVVMLFGIAFFSFLTAAISATFVKQDERPDELRHRLAELAGVLDAVAARLERIEAALLDGDRRGAR